MIAFLHWIISCLEVALWQIGVVCAGAMGNLWIISLFTVMWRILYGFLCFRLSVFSGSCLALWRNYYFVGIIGLGNMIQIFGI